MNSELVNLRSEKDRREREIEELKASKEALLQQLNEQKTQRKEDKEQMAIKVTGLESRLQEIKGDLAKEAKEKDIMRKELEDFKDLVKNTQNQQVEATSHNSAY